MPERLPVGESQSNGIIERALGLVAGQARTLKAALEHRIGTRVPPDARTLCWLVEFAAYLMNRCDIGSDGKTPLQILHGRRDNTLILEFEEKILYMPAKPARGGKWEPRFHPGVFVRMLNSSSEAVVVTEQGLAIKTRSANIKIIQMAVTMQSTFKSEWTGPAEMVPRSPGEVLMANKVAQSRLRTMGSQ